MGKGQQGSADPGKRIQPLPQCIAEEVDFFVGIFVREADADRAIGLTLGKTERKERGRRVPAMGGAGRAVGDTESPCGQEVQHGLAFDIRQGEAEDVLGAAGG